MLILASLQLGHKRRGLLLHDLLTQQQHNPLPIKDSHVRSLPYHHTPFTLTSHSDWNNADTKLLFLPPPEQDYSTDIWAPEIHFLDGLWVCIMQTMHEAS
jgi:hypothetical protein